MRTHTHIRKGDRDIPILEDNSHKLPHTHSRLPFLHTLSHPHHLFGPSASVHSIAIFLSFCHWQVVLLFDIGTTDCSLHGGSSQRLVRFHQVEETQLNDICGKEMSLDWIVWKESGRGLYSVLRRMK